MSIRCCLTMDPLRNIFKATNPEVQMRKRVTTAAFLAVLLVTPVFAFSMPKPAATKESKTASVVDTSYLSTMKWRLVGPFRGGRAVAVAGDPSNPLVFYFGSVDGGVWKTTDAGADWSNISDKYFKNSSIGAIAVAPSDPNVIYVGTGESDLRGDVTYGEGMYKSEDAGKTWSFTGLAETRHIAGIRIDPKNPDVVYVAAFGRAFGPNKERGVYKSIDGGKTWENVLFVNDSTGAIDLAMDPANSRILYAAMWQAQRMPWGFNSGGKGSGLYKSTDSGETWKNITDNKGFPKGIIGRIGIAVSPANPDRVWASVEAEEGGIYRSDNAGETWEYVNHDRDLRTRPWYFSRIVADPKNENTLYDLNVEFFKSIDGGAKFKRIGVPHGDNHDMWIDPNNADRMIAANDGGATVSLDGGKSWSTLDNQPTAQFYHVETDSHSPYRILGAQQDNSTVSILSRSDRGVITNEDFYDVGGGESGYIAVPPNDPNTIYAGSYGGLITRFDPRTMQRKVVSPWPDNPLGRAANATKYRFQWTFPIVIPENEPNAIYAAANVLFKSTDRGDSWSVISPDLTRADSATMVSSGGPITKDNTSVEYYGTIFAFAESPVKTGVLWAGSDDGLVHVSTDGGATWKNVTPKELPQQALISIIEPSHFDAGTAYVAATRYKFDDEHPYIYMTTDYGKSWKKITNGIPENDFTRVVRQDPVDKNILYAGTETHVYVSFNDGQDWQLLSNDLPIVAIHDLEVHGNNLIAATHGRAFWVLDDLSYLRQLGEGHSYESKILFASQPAIRFDGGRPAFKAPGYGENPPNGPMINFYLKSLPDSMSLSILDAAGALVKTFKGETKKPKAAEGSEETGPFSRGEQNSIKAEKGANRFVWNMRYPDPHKIKGAIVWGSTSGPLAAPGKYYAELNIDGKSYREPFELVKDPRVSATQQDFEKQFQLAAKIRDKMSQITDAVDKIHEIDGQLEGQMGRVKGTSYAGSVDSVAKKISAKLKAVEGELYQFRSHALEDPLNFPLETYEKLGSLMSNVESADAAPTVQAGQVYDELAAKADADISKVNDIIGTDLASFNKMVESLNVPAVIVKPAKD